VCAQTGYGEFQVTHHNGERADCYRQYLLPVLGRPNLTVLTEAKTLKVETERVGASTVTRGVTFQLKGQDGNKFSGGTSS
jgi:choline dehydrogenase-like flavoprotein